jgi:hypothetical protein
MKMNEKLGVPEGINEQASIIYNKIIDRFNQLKNDSDFDLPTNFDENNEACVLIGIYDINISDLNIKEIPFILVFNLYESLKESELVGASYSNKHSFNLKNNKIKIVKNPNKSLFSIRTAISSSVNKESFFERIENQLNTSIIAHELMHLYDTYKKREEGIEPMINYQSYQLGEFPPILSEFLHLLYFTTAVENTVRPTELYQMLLDNKITKSEFLDFVNNTDLIKRLKSAENFSLDEFKKKLNEDYNVIDMVEVAIENGYESVGSVADDALNLLFINITSRAIQTTENTLNAFMNSYISSLNPLEILFSNKIDEYNDIINNKFNQILNKYSKYKNDPEKYFEFLQKNLNFVGNKVKRKLYKLYDMVKDNKTNSILNWDLHTKISSKKNEKMVYTLDFKSFKRK